MMLQRIPWARVPVCACESCLADDDKADYADYIDSGATPGNSDSATGNRLRWTPSNS